MSELLEIILSAVDNASDVIDGIGNTAKDTADAIQDSFGGDSFDTMTASLEEANSEVERLEEELAAIYMGDIEGDAEAVEAALAAAQEEAQRLSDALKEAGESGGGLEESVNGIESLMAFQEISGYVTQLADVMWQAADTAGTVQDSWTRMGLAAEGAGINVDSMKGAVSDLSAETGRAGGSIRESFIAMTSAGITDMETMQTVFKGASAQAFILGTDVDSLANKFSGMAMKSTLSERTLKGTGVTMEELAEAMGMTGATADEVKAKWSELDVNQRAAALGMAASMNEGKDANDSYKNSWEGLQAQIDIAKGKLEVLLGKVFLPVLIPAMEAAGRVLDWLGSTIGAVMDGPFGTLISVLGSAGGALILLLAGVTAITAGMGFFTASLYPAIAASWALIAPWLPFIAAGIAVVAIIYEIGKAFGWWTDVGSMLDAIGAGLQRLWDAFINHPDVQAAIQIISEAIGVLWGWIQQAGQAILEFFGITTGGNFDIVRALIDSIGAAWNAITAPIRFVIGLVQQVIGVFDQFRNGQMDLPTFIMTLLTTLLNAYMSVFNAIINFVISIGSRLVSAGVSAARRLVTGMVNQLRQLRSRVRSALATVVTVIVTTIQSWINAARNKALGIVNGVGSVLRGTYNSVTSALSNVKNAIVKPFQDAYNEAKKIWDNITSLGGVLSAGYDYLNGQNPDGSWNVNAAGYELPTPTNNTIIQNPVNETLDINHNIVLDFKDVPAGMDMDVLMKSFENPNFIRALVDNNIFQDIDARVKTRLEKKNGRARGY